VASSCSKAFFVGSPRHLEVATVPVFSFGERNGWRRLIRLTGFPLNDLDVVIGEDPFRFCGEGHYGDRISGNAILMEQYGLFSTVLN
jgi:hypothetical protein